MLTDEQLADLRAKAKAATPGPWEWNENEAWLCAPDPDNSDNSWIIIEADRRHEIDDDSVYLASVDPTTVLELLDEISRLRADAAGFDVDPYSQAEIEREAMISALGQVIPRKVSES